MSIRTAALNLRKNKHTCCLWSQTPPSPVRRRALGVQPGVAGFAFEAPQRYGRSPGVGWSPRTCCWHRRSSRPPRVPRDFHEPLPTPRAARAPGRRGDNWITFIGKSGWHKAIKHYFSIYSSTCWAMSPSCSSHLWFSLSRTEERLFASSASFCRRCTSLKKKNSKRKSITFKQGCLDHIFLVPIVMTSRGPLYTLQTINVQYYSYIKNRIWDFERRWVDHRFNKAR